LDAVSPDRVESPSAELGTKPEKTAPHASFATGAIDTGRAAMNTVDINLRCEAFVKKL
jgi:hypothetical protein